VFRFSSRYIIFIFLTRTRTRTLTLGVNMSSSSSSSSSLYAIDKLTGDNFSSWKFRLQLVLMDRGLWEIVDGTEVAPIVVFSGNAGDGALSTMVGSDGSGKVKVDPKVNAMYLEWKKRDNQALAQIALTVSNSELIHIRGAKSSHDAWNKICSVYEAKGLAAKVYLRRRFFNIKYMDSGIGSMQSHINLVRDIADQLDAIGAGVSDEDMAMTLLCSLPDSYDYLIVALEARNSSDLTFDFVSTRLLSEEKRKEESNNVSINANIIGNVKHNHGNNGNNGNIIHNVSNTYGSKNVNNSDNIALYTNSNGNNNKSKSFKPSIKCSYCNKKNHTEEKCYAKHGYPIGHSKHNNNANMANMANIASVSVNNATLHAFVATNNVDQHHNNASNSVSWLIDSGASMHLCNNRNYFDMSTFKPIQHKNVILGNNECISAIGIGDIPVRINIDNNTITNTNNNTTNIPNTHNGNINNSSNIIDVVFKDVLYVPDIAANLLSVAKMTNNGVNVIFNGNECNIMNKVGQCIGNAYKHTNSNLYRMNVQSLCAMNVKNASMNVNNVNNVNNNTHLQH
jgi:hypothetical protein